MGRASSEAPQIVSVSLCEVIQPEAKELVGKCQVPSVWMLSPGPYQMCLDMRERGQEKLWVEVVCTGRGGATLMGDCLCFSEKEWGDFQCVVCLCVCVFMWKGAHGHV